jgi:5-methylthioadenosine/S-adenosylhomocysteine deaminase
MSTAITNATIVTGDEDNTVLFDATIVIRAERIDAIGPTASVNTDGCDIVDARGGIVHPALINAHSHLAMTLFRGVADDRNLEAFLARIFPLEAALLDEAAIRTGISLAIAESFLAGSVRALDMYFWPEAAAETAASLGFSLATGPTFIGFPSPDTPSIAVGLERFEAAPWEWVVAHGTYTMTEEELGLVADLRRHHAARFTIHAAETEAEVQDVVEKTGKRPIGVLDDAGLLGPGSVLAHGVWLTDDEVTLLGATRSAVAHCPLSNMKLASGVCRVTDLLAAGATVALGTDGPASSNDLDLYQAMRMAALMAKVHSGDATALPASEVLAMATRHGAVALGVGDSTGVIKVGFDADLVVLDASSPALNPVHDPVGAIVYAASRADVVEVWSRGRRVVERGQLVTIDLASVLEAAKAFGARC